MVQKKEQHRNYKEGIIVTIMGVAYIATIIYVIVIFSGLRKKEEGLVEQYNVLAQTYEEMSQEKTTTHLEEEKNYVLKLWNACTNINSITWEEAEKVEIRDEYIQSRVASLVDNLAYTISGLPQFKDKQTQVEMFYKDIEALEKDVGRKTQATANAKLYAKYLQKIFR